MDSNQWAGPEGRNIQPENRMKKQEFKKNEESLWNLWDNFNCSNIRIIGVPEGKEEEQEIENLFEKIMKGRGSMGTVLNWLEHCTHMPKIMKDNFPNLAKERDMQD